MSFEPFLKKISASLSPSTYEKVMKLVREKKRPISRLIGIALDNELNRENPFEFNADIPEEEHAEYSFTNEGGKILEFIGTHEGFGLDLLLLCREDIGVPEKERFLAAFKEIANKDLIEPYKNLAANIRTKVPYEEDYVVWRLAKDLKPQKVKLTKKRATEYEQYQKLKKRFKDG